MPHHFRSPINTRHEKAKNIQDPIVGRFKATAINDIRWIANLIEVGNANAHQSEIDAVPDVWARILNFEIAFYQREHVLHEQVWDEWCGFLTLLALAEMRNLPLQADELNLKNFDASHPEYNHVFIQSLKQMLPNRSPLNDKNPWSQIHLFSLNGHPLALSNNQTLIATAAEYDFRRFNVNVQWFNDLGRLIKPYGFLHDTEYLGLMLWLNNLHQQLTQSTPKYSSEIHGPDSLKKRVERFAQELLQYCESQPPAGLSEPLHQTSNQKGLARLNSVLQKLGQLPVKLSAQTPVTHDAASNNARFRFTGMYAPFEQVVARPAVDLQDSAVLIQPVPQNQAGLLLLDPAVQGSLGLAAHQVMIYGSINLSVVDFQALSTGQRNRLAGQALNDSVRWIRPEDFFCTDLWVMVGGNCDSLSPDAYAVAGIKDLRLEDDPVVPVIPLKQEILDYLGAAYLRENLCFEQLNGQEIRVVLTLKLGRQQQIHRIHQTYNLNENIQIAANAITQIWPNFTHDRLLSHYCFYYTTDPASGNAFQVKPYPQARIAEYAQYNIDRELIDSQIAGHVFKTGTRDQFVQHEVMRCNGYPEALLCLLQSGRSQQVQQTYIGLILLPVPEHKRSQNSDAIIGVDLGTSNTNLYMHLNDTIEPVVFHEPTQSLFANILVLSNASRNYDLFLPNHPAHSESAPLNTLYEVFYEREAPASNSVLEGHVRFLEDFIKFDLSNPQIKKNLKWSADHPQEQKYLTPFFMQLCLQACMSAVQQGSDRIHFRFSHPSAFSQDQWNEFSAAIHNALGQLQNNIYEGVRYDENHSEKESVCSTYYFASGQTNASVGNFYHGLVILDIGGGTTDIAVLQGRTPAFKCLSSVKLAGRQLFIEALMRHPEAFEALSIPIPDKVRQQLGKHPLPDFVYSQLDALIKGSENQINELLPTVAGSLKGLIHEMAIGIAGLFFYMGTVIESLRLFPTPDAEPYYNSPEDLPRFYIGGNASRIFHWFTYGKDFSQAGSNAYSLLFERAFLKQKQKSQSNPFFEEVRQTRIEIHPTSRQYSKPEVAYGLVLDHEKMELQGKNITSVFFAGEDHLIEGKPRKHTDFLDRTQHLPLLDPYQIDQSQISLFIDIVQDELKLKLDKNKLLRQINDDVSSQLMKVQRHPGQIQDEGALFIQEVKSLLRHLQTGRIK